MLIFKHMCVASDSRTIVVAMLLFVENEYEIGIIVRSLGVSGVTPNYLTSHINETTKGLSRVGYTDRV